MKILITGGAGFIGSHTADELLGRGYLVRVLDNLQKPVHLKGKPKYLDDRIEFVYGDVRNKDVLKYAMEGVEGIFHFAAYQDYLPDFSTYFSVNSVSTALIYEIIVENNLPVKKIIVASSQAVLGEGLYRCREHGNVNPDIRKEEKLKRGVWDHFCPICEKQMDSILTAEKDINPQNQYALSKYSQESTALNLGKRYGIPSVALRYSIVQGPRQSFYNAYSGAMRIFALNLYFNKAPVIFEDGRQIRDYINIGDVVKANLLVLEDKRADFEVFNVGGGKRYTVKEFYDLMGKVTGKEIEPVIGKYYRYGDTRHIASDITKLERLGWSPKVPVEKSITDYWEYLITQENIENILEFAEKNMMRLNVVRKIGN